MFKYLCLLLGLLIASPAYAGFGVWNPPARYDHPYAGRTIINNSVPLRCGLAWACTYPQYPSVGNCTIFIPKEGTRRYGSLIDHQAYKNLLRHETGHCNGWPPNHPR